MALAAVTLLKGILWIALFPVFKIADEPTHFENVQYRGEHFTPPQTVSGEAFGSTIHPNSPHDVRLAWEVTNRLWRNRYVEGVRSVRDENVLRTMASDPETRRGSGQLTSASYPGFYYNVAVPMYEIVRRLSVLTRVAAIRFVSLLFGILAVVATFYSARLIMRSRALAIAAAMVVMLQPMESQMTAAVNNDAGVIGLAAALLYLQLRFIIRAPEIPSIRWGVLGALLAGAIVFTKAQGFAMLPGYAVACAWIVVRNIRDRRAWIFAAVSAVISGALVLASFHHMEATGQMAPMATTASSSSGGAHPQQASFWTYVSSLDPGYKLYLFRSFFGQFGWLEYSIPYYWLDCVRMVWKIVQIGFVVALVVRIARLPGSSWLAIRGFLFCVGTALFALGFILFVEHRFNLIGIWGVVQGRGLLFALPPLAVASAACYGALVPARFRTLSAAALATCAAMMHAGAVIYIFRYHYGT